MPRFTIITPTFDHGPVLAHAIACVKRQSFSDYEHIVVGDGIVAAGREIALAYERDDPRARFIDNPKGPENGQIHRDTAIRDHASGELIAYLSDDDLWFDDHLATLDELARTSRADFLHTMTVCPMADGEIGLFYADFSNPVYRSELLKGHTPVVPSTVAHTRDSYLRLPKGWTDKLPGTAADITLWLQFIDLPGVRFASSGRATALHMPAGDPTREPGDEARFAQIAGLREQIEDRSGAVALRDRLTDLIYRHAADRQAESIHFQQLARELEERLAIRPEQTRRPGRFARMRERLR